MVSMPPKIIPTIFTKKREEFTERLKTVEGLVDRVQIDVIDGIFLPEETVPLETASELETSLKIDVHLMVDEPANWIKKGVQVMAARLIGQIERMSSQEEFISRVVQAEMEPGLALDWGTGLEKLELEPLSGADAVLLMSRKAGFGAWPFEDKIIAKIKKLAKLRNDNSFQFKIMIDGGLGKENILKVAQAGADELAVGGAIFNQPDPAQAIKGLKRIISG